MCRSFMPSCVGEEDTLNYHLSAQNSSLLTQPYLATELGHHIVPYTCSTPVCFSGLICLDQVKEEYPTQSVDTLVQIIPSCLSLMLTKTITKCYTSLYTLFYVLHNHLLGKYKNNECIKISLRQFPVKKYRIHTGWHVIPK